jgi:PKD repeat protein
MKRFIYIILLISTLNIITYSQPTLSLSAPSTGLVDEVLLVDARNSTNVSNLPQTDGSPSVTINFGDGFTCNLLACSHIYRAAGVYTISLTAKNAVGQTASTNSSITITAFTKCYKYSIVK